ncbi:hypothetical protein BO86DRAFT_379125 [Aspergillus japonicus CBS 114.51]|uniref:Cell wall protein n=1 Tax=Aspergillus japonicus CBS 114.51 TaxID=1448312 RepID=A0A8T8X2J7_ASPJA|nr:hypothetical protein BO86DRAFT_379125 [Aspergillus japonicus CBS 114.51]RAH82154.1 hypothetical protein BO86DRAFT_379125 [Aspergillus japonicus CBS 114.51]
MFAPFKVAVLLTVCILATLTLASENVGAVETVHDDESFIAIPLAMHEHDPRDVTIIKTICETSTSVISTTGPANPPATGTTGLPPANPTSQSSSHSESQSAPPAPTTVPGTVVQPPVTSKPEGVSPTSVPGTTGQTPAQPPVTSKTEAAPSPTSNTKETSSLPSTSASHSASPVSSSTQDITHSATTLTTASGTGTSAASGTHTTAPPSSEASGNGGMRAALLAFAATFLIFFSI